MPPNQFAQVTSLHAGRALDRLGVARRHAEDHRRRADGDDARRRTARPTPRRSRRARRAATANRNTAIATLIIVSAVRRLLRRALFRTRPMNFMSSSGGPGRSSRNRPPTLLDRSIAYRCALLDQRALLEVQEVRGALGRVRIVRHHHDRLLELLIQPLQERQNLAGRLGVEIAGRLVGEQQRRVGDDRARDGDALLLSARKLPRIVLRRDRRGRRCRARSSRGRAAASSTGWSAAAAARRSRTPSAPESGCRAER